jgi:hypothetical protein
MGAQGSARAVVLLGGNFIWAHAGDEIRRIAKTSFFIGLSRKMYAIQPALNRIGGTKSIKVISEEEGGPARSPTEYLARKIFDQEICSPLRDENCGQLTAYSTFLGQVVQELVQRLISGFMGRPI